MQILVAAGEKLPYKQEDFKQKGHAIECRICAEDPDKGFLPTTGTINRVGSPLAISSRLDCGYVDGGVVGVNYDPMLAKLITHAPTREEAIIKMLESLSEVVFAGIKSNRDYLRRLLDHPEFHKGHTHTHFIPQHAESLKPRSSNDKAWAPLLAAYLLSEGSKKTSGASEAKNTPWLELGGFRN